jgi:shikimate dehydrogenase
MKHYGLIGYPLSHSFSRKYFTEKFEKEHITDHVYELFEIKNLGDFPELLRANTKLCGLNVTVPHKIGIVRYMDWISEEAKKVGAVNCIRISAESPVLAAFSGEVGIQDHDFKLEGFNTDVYGFEHSLKPLLKKHHTKALLLGNGGAARAVKCVLDKLEIEYILVTRKPGRDHVLFKDLTKKMVEEHTIIINTTPLGTAPNIDECPPIPYEYITDKHLLYDLIYNPEQTLFLKQGHEKGAATKNGFEMLILQAEKSWEIWQSNEVAQ